jgi:hypothetical protein
LQLINAISIRTDKLLKIILLGNVNLIIAICAIALNYYRWSSSPITS